MLVTDIMNGPVVTCTPWDTAQTAAGLMKTHAIGAIPVVSDALDPLLEGIVTDRDLCLAIVASARSASRIPVADVMTRVPVTCLPESSIEECLAFMGNCQVRRIPVVDEGGRCVGIVSQADVVRYAATREVVATLRAISDVPKSGATVALDKNYFYCGQLHESDQIALLERRRQQAALEEVLQ